MAKLNTPKGTRDFLPEQVARRNYIFQTVKDVFDTFGFSPIETPAMELKETLMGKYGEEGDRLIFKILARGDKLKKALSNDSEAQLSEEALRYDLTVPFARFVVQHQNDLSFPFKRYQIQPVWRADRPQKGRYREFYQCDVDMIGSDSLLNEVELIQLVSEVFTKLKLPEATIKLNNRKILEGIAQVIGEPEKLIDITVALDKLDKIGREKVEAELRKKGLSVDSISQLGVLFESSSLESVSGFLSDSEVGQKGVEELNFIFDYAKELGLKNCEFDPTLARGLNYYTGAIFEVVHPDFPSSICGGGRYDDLTGIFGLKNVSGVGVSFGADRIYDLMLDKELFPVQVSETTKLMFVNFGEIEAKQSVKWAYALRLEGINTEVYPDSAKMKKQMKYANDKNIPFVALVGDKEIESGLLTVKDMNKGDQWEVSISDLIKKLK
jgi:histidyl-tRNA synthetase